MAEAAAHPIHVELTLGVEGRIEDDPLAVLRGITTGVESLQPVLREAVHAARQQRLTWDEIGQALGVTRQSAWERFGAD
jgi:hypothetical protein